MKAHSTIKAAILALSSLGLLACDSYDGNEEEEGGNVQGMFESKASFESAMNRTGTAKGTSFSGSYSVIFRSGQFSDDCTVAFVRQMDFYVDDSAPDAELSRTLAEVVVDYGGTIQITQQDGRITFDADGDGVEGSLTGWIDSDGSFQAVTGLYQNDRNHWLAYHAGTIENGRIQGVFAQRVRSLDDDDVSGSCTWSADVEPGPAEER